MTLKAQSIKEEVNNWDFIKVKNFCSSKDITKRMKRQATDWKKIFAKHILQNQYAEYIKNSQNSVRKPNFKMGKRFEQTLQ